MKYLTFTLIAFSAFTAYAGADAFDDKSRAAYQQDQDYQNQLKREKEAQELTSLDNQLLAHVPKNAVITKCVTEQAFFDFQLQMTEWHGIPLEESSDQSYSDQSFPPQLFSCHYHVNVTNQDCAVTGTAPEHGHYPKLTTTCY